MKFEFQIIILNKRLFMREIYTLLLIFGLISSLPQMAYSQLANTNNTVSSINNTEGTIDGLYIYPNPVSNGRIYITTKKKLTKEIEIYDVLGKKIVSTQIFDKSLDVSEFSPGVYILKIKEGDASATRKLVIR